MMRLLLLLLLVMMSSAKVYHMQVMLNPNAKLCRHNPIHHMRPRTGSRLPTARGHALTVMKT